MPEPLFTYRLTPFVLGLAGLAGARATELLARCGFPEAAATGACTVPLGRVKTLLEEAAAAKGDPAFGLALAFAVPEGTYDEAELLVRTAPSIGAGLEALARFAELINPIGSFRYESGQLHYVVAGQREGLGRHQNEYTIAYVLRGLRLLADAPVDPTEVWFAHAQGDGAALVEAHFGCPVRYGAATSGLAFSRATLDGPLRSRDGVVHDFLARRAARAQQERAPEPFSASVARAIEEEVGFARADLAAVAKHLGVTERTAQRRLHDEGTTFREVLDQLRRRVAAGLAAQPAALVAERLGFADVKSYRQAARRWSAT